MKLMIISDSHGNYPLAIRSISEVEQPDALIHLGDDVEDACIIEGIVNFPVVKIAGNCDRGSTSPREILQVFDGVKFLITHGDAYGVKGGLERLLRRAEEVAARVVLYGHTHCSAITHAKGILFLNPGTLHRDCQQQSYATIILTNNKVSPHLTFIKP
jgi:putative phosphoesterase